MGADRACRTPRATRRRPPADGRCSEADAAHADASSHGRNGAALRVSTCATGIVVLCGNPKCSSASAEGNDAADRIVRRDAYGHPIARNDLDPEAAHPAAEL